MLDSYVYHGGGDLDLNAHTNHINNTNMINKKQDIRQQYRSNMNKKLKSMTNKNPHVSSTASKSLSCFLRWFLAMVRRTSL